MKQDPLPPARLERFEQVTVIGSSPGCAPYLGQRGTVLWRDPYYARKEPDRPGRWQYVVYLPAARCCRTFFESALHSEGAFDPESAHFGEWPEVSFDIVLEADNDFVEGCYRLPGRFWEVLIFTRADVPKLRWMADRWDSGITGTIFRVPREARLDRDYVLAALSQAFGHAVWAQVQGPDSMALR
jgi:hypothetical protein